MLKNLSHAHLIRVSFHYERVYLKNPINSPHALLWSDLLTQRIFRVGRCNIDAYSPNNGSRRLLFRNCVCWLFANSSVSSTTLCAVVSGNYSTYCSCFSLIFWPSKLEIHPVSCVFIQKLFSLRDMPSGAWWRIFSFTRR